MAELEISREARLELKARAHALDAVVLLGSAGLTEAVVREIDRALAAHELVKVRVPGDDREQRETWFAEIAQRLSAARVASIGKLLIVYRPRPDAPSARAADGPARRSPAGKGPAPQAVPHPRRPAGARGRGTTGS